MVGQPSVSSDFSSANKVLLNFDPNDLQALPGYPNIYNWIDLDDYLYIKSSSKAAKVREFVKRKLLSSEIRNHHQLLYGLESHGNRLMLGELEKDEHVYLVLDMRSTLLVAVIDEKKAFINVCWGKDCVSKSQLTYNRYLLCDSCGVSYERLLTNSGTYNVPDFEVPISKNGLRIDPIDEITSMLTGPFSRSRFNPDDVLRLELEDAFKHLIYITRSSNTTPFSARHDMTPAIFETIKKMTTGRVFKYKYISILYDPDIKSFCVKHNFTPTTYVKGANKRSRMLGGFQRICAFAEVESVHCLMPATGNCRFCYCHMKENWKAVVFEEMVNICGLKDIIELDDDALLTVKQHVMSKPGWTFYIGQLLRLNVTREGELRIGCFKQIFKLCTKFDAGCREIIPTHLTCKCNTIAIYAVALVYALPVAPTQPGYYLSLFHPCNKRNIEMGDVNWKQVAQKFAGKQVVNRRRIEQVRVIREYHNIEDREMAMTKMGSLVLVTSIEAIKLEHQIFFVNVTPPLTSMTWRDSIQMLRKDCKVKVTFVNHDIVPKDFRSAIELNVNHPVPITDGRPKIYCISSQETLLLYIGLKELTSGAGDPEIVARCHRYKSDTTRARLIRLLGDPRFIRKYLLALVNESSGLTKFGAESIVILVFALASQLFNSDKSNFNVLNQKISSTMFSKNFLHELNRLLFHFFGMCVEVDGMDAKKGYVPVFCKY